MHAMIVKMLRLRLVVDLLAARRSARPAAPRPTCRARHRDWPWSPRAARRPGSSRTAIRCRSRDLDRAVRGNPRAEEEARDRIGSNQGTAATVLGVLGADAASASAPRWGLDAARRKDGRLPVGRRRRWDRPAGGQHRLQRHLGRLPGERANAPLQRDQHLQRRPRAARAVRSVSRAVRRAGAGAGLSTAAELPGTAAELHAAARVAAAGCSSGAHALAASGSAGRRARAGAGAPAGRVASAGLAAGSARALKRPLRSSASLCARRTRREARR